jgi:phosphopantothenoylcysteine decarboxylase/phosphopantothenate--cysteine ligase
VAAAAVCDFRPRDRVEQKIGKSEGLRVDWVRTPDILEEIAPRKGGRIHVGFALETGPLENAAAKMERKSLDMIVANDPRNFGTSRGSFLILERSGARSEFTDVTKETLARAILDRAEAM